MGTRNRRDLLPTAPEPDAGAIRPARRRRPAESTRATPTDEARRAADPVDLDRLMPLDVLLRAMREHFAAGRFDEAAAFAKDAAPYLHVRQTTSAQAGGGASLVRLEWLDPE